MADAWPEGVPEEERALVGRLSTGMRDVVAKRLRAVTRWSGATGARQSSVKEAAAEAGISTQRFYAMAAEWRGAHSIAVLGARAAEKQTRTERLAPGARAAAGSVIQDVLREDPDARITSIVERLAAAGVPSMSYTMVRRLWLEAKRTGPPGGFGGELLVDSAGLDAMWDGERIRLYVVLDGGTGLVLGSVAATNGSRAWGHVHAAEFAIGNLPSLDLTGFSAAAAEPSIVLSLQEDDAEGGGVLERRLKDAGIPCVIRTGAAGRAVFQALGEKVGPIWLGVGERDDGISYRNGRPSRMAEYTAELHVALQEAIEAHNARRRAAAQADPSSDSLDEVKRLVSRALGVIADGAGELEMLPSYSEDWIAEL